jgi:hypothetical protein
LAVYYRYRPGHCKSGYGYQRIWAMEVMSSLHTSNEEKWVWTNSKHFQSWRIVILYGGRGGSCLADMGGHGGGPVEEGTHGIVWAATLLDDGPSGGFFYGHGKSIFW